MILFLGAGASKAFQIPTTKEFISLFEKEIGESELFNDVKVGIEEDLFDLESLLTILDDLSKPKEELLRDISPYTCRFLLEKQGQSGLLYYEKPGINEEAKQLLHRVKKTVRKECLTAVRDRRSLIVDTYDAFFDAADKLVSSHTQSRDAKRSYPSDLVIFTTNYDTCLETYFNAKHQDFVNGIEPGRWGYNIFNVETFRGGYIEVVKLHGSIDLFKKGEDIRQLQTFDENFEPLITYLGEDYGQEFMVYPIESSSARHVIQSPYWYLYNLLRDRLSKEINRDRDSVLLLVGSSFRDLTITSIMNEVLKLSRARQQSKIIFIDPKVKLIIERIKADGFPTLADLVTPIEGEFGAADVFDQLAKLK